MTLQDRTLFLENEEAIDLLRVKVSIVILNFLKSIWGCIRGHGARPVPLSASSWNFLDINKILWSKDTGDLDIQIASPRSNGKIAGTHE